MKKFYQIFQREHGQAVVLFGLLVVVFMGFTTLVVDVGAEHITKTNMQKVADAAALAGAQDLPNTATAINTALNYAEANGAERSHVVVTTPYNGDSTKIQVVCTKNVQYSIARVFGFTDRDISARSVAQKAGMGGGPFNYAVFSGSSSNTLSFSGSNTYISGSIHSNDDLTINGSNQTITGSAEAVSKFTMNGSNQTISGTCQAATITTKGSNITIGQKLQSAASSLTMPDFSDLIQAEAEDAGQAYIGNKTFNGSNLSVASPIYVKGNLTVNGSNFTGKGVVLVSGDITFNGSNLSTAGGSVCFYSENGDITINGSNITLEGLIYAPNGTIAMHGSNQTINGRVIGQNIAFNGSNYTITAGDHDLDSLPMGGVQLVE